MTRDEFMEFLRSGKKLECNAGEGGFLLPPTFSRPRKGAWAWLLRLVGNKQGWDEINTIEYIKRGSK